MGGDRAFASVRSPPLMSGFAVGRVAGFGTPILIVSCAFPQVKARRGPFRVLRKQQNRCQGGLVPEGSSPHAR
jgi:hypothetical protein